MAFNGEKVQKTRRCAIVGCKNDKEINGYSFYDISPRRRRQLKWLEICNLPESTPKYARLCEGHFSAKQFEEIDCFGKMRMKTNAVPDILMANPPRTLKDRVITPYEFKKSDACGNAVFEKIAAPRRIRSLANATSNLTSTIQKNETENSKKNASIMTPEDVKHDEAPEDVKHLLEDRKHLLEHVRDLEQENSDLHNKIKELHEEVQTLFKLRRALRKSSAITK